MIATTNVSWKLSTRRSKHTTPKRMPEIVAYLRASYLGFFHASWWWRTQLGKLDHGPLCHLDSTGLQLIFRIRLIWSKMYCRLIGCLNNTINVFTRSTLGTCNTLINSCMVSFRFAFWFSLCIGSSSSVVLTVASLLHFSSDSSSK